MTPVTIKLPRPKIEPSLPQKTEVKRKKTSMRFHFPERVRSTPEEFKMANYSLVDKMYKGFCYTGVCKKFIGTEEVPFENPPCNAYMYSSRLVKYVNSPVNGHDHRSRQSESLLHDQEHLGELAGFYCTALIVQEKEVPAIIRAIKGVPLQLPCDHPPLLPAILPPLLRHLPLQLPPQPLPAPHHHLPLPLPRHGHDPFPCDSSSSLTLRQSLRFHHSPSARDPRQPQGRCHHPALFLPATQESRVRHSLCVSQQVRLLAALNRRSLALAPRTMAQLDRCLQSRLCHTQKGFLPTHVGIPAGCEV